MTAILEIFIPIHSIQEQQLDSRERNRERGSGPRFPEVTTEADKRQEPRQKDGKSEDEYPDERLAVARTVAPLTRRLRVGVIVGSYKHVYTEDTEDT